MNKITKERCQQLQYLVEDECYSDEEFRDVMMSVPSEPLDERYAALARIANEVVVERASSRTIAQLVAEARAVVDEYRTRVELGALADALEKVDRSLERRARLQAARKSR